MQFGSYSYCTAISENLYTAHTLSAKAVKKSNPTRMQNNGYKGDLTHAEVYRQLPLLKIKNPECYLCQYPLCSSTVQLQLLPWETTYSQNNIYKHLANVRFCFLFLAMLAAWLYASVGLSGGPTLQARLKRFMAKYLQN